MALVLADRVLETTAVAGTGTASLLGAQNGYQAFSVIGNGNTTYYTIVDNVNFGWEVGIGTYSANTLTRDTVLSSSNGGAKVYFGSGTKDIFLDLPSEVVLLTAGDVTGPASAINNNFASFNLTTGKLIKDSGFSSASFATSAQGAKADTAVQPGSLATVATTGSYTDLINQPTIPAAQVNSDWTATTGVAQILHKPTLGTASALDAGVANGVATLDGGGTVPTSQLPAAVLGALKYQGTWNATTNVPTLTSSVGTQGYYYVVATAGSTNLDGITDWKIGDWAIYSGTAWQKIDNTDAVTSVNSFTGTVVLTASDVGAQPAFTSQLANYVYAAPDGSAGVPVFRALVSADIPALSGTYIPYTGATGAVDLNAKTVVNIANLGVNTTTIPTIKIRAIGDNNSSSRIAMRGYSSNASSSSIRVTKFRGTAGAPQAPQSGDSLGKFELAGYGTTSADGYAQASFEGVATEAWGAIARGTKTLIKVTPNTTTTQVTAVTVDQDKSVTLAGDLNVTGTTTLATSLSGLAKLTSGVVSTATSGTDYAPATSGTSILYGNNAGGFSNVTIGSGVSFAGGTLSATGSGGTVTSVTGTAPVVSSGGTTPAISMAAASGTVNGYLTSTDWTTFNNKQPAGSYLTASTGVTTFSGNSTGLTPATATSGAITLGGTLNVTNGGTGLTTLTANYIPYGNGASALQSSSSLNYTTTTLSAPQVNASNGIHVNNQTVGANYTIPTGSSANSVGPMTISSGIVVSISSGSRWVVL